MLPMDKGELVDMKKHKLLFAAVCIVMAVLLLPGCKMLSSLTGRFTRGETSAQPTTMSSLTGDETTAAQTTQQAQTTDPGVAVPAVIDLYALEDTYALDADFSAGFQVKIPMIDSAKPGAQAINAEMELIKQNMEHEYANAGNLADYGQFNKTSYEYAVDRGVLFLSIYSVTAYYASEFIAGNLHYAYDFGADRRLTNAEVAALYGMDEAGVVAAVNAALAARGASPVTGFDKIDLFVNGSGVFSADAKVESMLGGEYPEIVALQ